MPMQQSHFACKCLNVQVRLPSNNDTQATVKWNVEGTRATAAAQSLLSKDFLVPKNVTPTIEIAQSLLTTRVVLPASPPTRPVSLTGLVCLNCRTTVYAVDKVSQQAEDQRTNSKARSIGFTATTTGSSLVASDASQQHILSSSSSARDTSRNGVSPDGFDTLRPALGQASTWILAGCVCDAEAIASMSSSLDFSSSYGLVVAKKPQSAHQQAEPSTSAVLSSGSKEESPNPISQSSATNTDSPLRHSSRHGNAMLSSALNRSSPSPSPARRRRAATLVSEEEEQGDDMDTLHLLETLLPHLPHSILQDTTRSAGEITSSTRRTTSSTAVPSSTTKSPDKSGSHIKQLDARLDAQAFGVLRLKREEARRAIYSLLRLKSAELQQVESALREDARQLHENAVQFASAVRPEQQPRDAEQQQDRDPAVVQGQITSENSSDHTMVTSCDVDGGESGSLLFVRRRPLVPMMEKSTSQDSDLNKKQTSGAVGVPGAELSSSLSNTQGSLGMGSHLSASFAMRGRDLPSHLQKQQERSEEEEEEWYAHKKRLRERYPHADHSALPSAVNSDDESAIAVKKRSDESDDIESDGEAGRGRGRGRERERHAVENRDPTPSHKTPTPPKKRGPSDADTTKGSGTDDLSQSVRTVRGALKSGNTTSDARTAPPAEKKVAFASTTEEREATTLLLADDTGDEKEDDEPGDALFEIDEDLDSDEVLIDTSDTTVDERSAALHQGAQDVVKDAMQRDEGDDADDEKEADERAGQESIAQSLPMAGSLSALAESELRRVKVAGDAGTSVMVDEDADDFDPASLRFDGREVYTTGESLRNGSLEPSSHMLESHAAKLSSRYTRIDRQRASQSAREAILAGFPSERLEKSAIGFRVAVGEAEAQLSGLLAPHAPSHRDLYAAKQNNKGARQKYKLEGLSDDEDWDSEGTKKGKTTDLKSRNENVRRGKVQSSNTETLKDAYETPEADPMMLARSMPINAPVVMRRASSSAQRHDTSGFDLEPKTSLPYRERHLTPSLRKAMRPNSSSSKRPVGSSLARFSPAAISDSSAEINIGSGESASEVVPGRPPPVPRDSSGSIVSGVKPVSIAGAKASADASRSPAFKYALPGSVTTRGFEVSNDVASPATQTKRMLNNLSVQSSPMLSSSADTGRSSRTRSPNSPYVRPPPPSSKTLRLKPDPKHRPAPLGLAPVTELYQYEEGEQMGDVAQMLEFMHVVEELKEKKRTGWLHHRIDYPESIADHMYRMGMLSMLLPENMVDIGKCVQLCLVHDLAEALVGDLTPLDGVSKEDKVQREKDAIEYLVHDQLLGSRAALRIEALWNEYEDRKTLESRVVKDLDRFELALQAVEYERRYKTQDLQPFFDGSTKHIAFPPIQRWIRQLALEREALWKETEFAYTQSIPDDLILVKS